MIEFSMKEKDGIVIVEYKLPGPITPEDAAKATETAPEVKGNKLLVLSGRGPIWLYAMLLHKYMHSVSAIAIYDPKLGGGVVVATHTPEYRVGEVIEV